jgi:hypothetical protein
MRSLENPLQEGLARNLLSDIRALPNDKGAVKTLTGRDHYQYFDKISRAVYFLVKGKPFVGSCLSVYRQNLGANPLAQEVFTRLAPYLNNPLIAKMGPCAHRDIFDYRYFVATSQANSIFVTVMRFYQDVEVLTFLTPEGIRLTNDIKF